MKENIREVTLEELSECVQVIQNAFKTVADQYGFTIENAPRFTAFSINENRLKQQLCVEKRPMYVFLLDGKMVGYYSLVLLSEKEIELNNLSVLPEYRHNKIGTKLLQDCFERARKLGAEKIKIGIVEENMVLRAWYEKNGFIIQGRKNLTFSHSIVDIWKRKFENFKNMSRK